MSSKWSLWSEDSLLCIGCRGSLLSVGSIGSVASIGSIGSAASILSVGSVVSVSSAMSARSRRSIMSAGRDRTIMGRPWSVGAKVIALAFLAAGLVRRERAKGPGNESRVRWIPDA